MTEGLTGVATAAGRDATARRRWSRSNLSVADPTDGALLALASVLLVAYAVLRTVGASDAIVLAWAVLGAVLALVWPLVGAVLVAALGPFTEAQTDGGLLTALPVLVGALGLAVLGRAAITWRSSVDGWPRATAAVLLTAAALAVGTGLAIVTTWVRFGPTVAASAAELWATGIASGVTVLLAGALLARHRPSAGRVIVGVVIASLVAAAVLSLVDFVARGSLDQGPLGWLLRPSGSVRLSGIIPAPNAAATMFLVPAAILASAAVLGGRASDPSPITGSWRVAAASVAAVVTVAVVLTYSRSALVALPLIVMIIAWRIRPLVAVVLGIGMAAIGAIVLVPFALQSRVTTTLPGGLSTQGDVERFDGWSAAIRMWVDSPLIGQGFRSFPVVARDFGSNLAAPHNEWLRLFAEGGVVVGLVGLMFVVAGWLTLGRDRSWLGTGVLAAFAGFVVMACFNNPLTYIQVVVPVFLTVGAAVGLAASRTEAAR